eukprot:363096-Chlamydomonas_euryale.AAC.16
MCEAQQQHRPRGSLLSCDDHRGQRGHQTRVCPVLGCGVGAVVAGGAAAAAAVSVLVRYPFKVCREA